MPLCAGGQGLVSGYGWENRRSVTPTGDGFDGAACHDTAVLYSHGTAAEN